MFSVIKVRSIMDLLEPLAKVALFPLLITTNSLAAAQASTYLLSVIGDAHYITLALKSPAIIIPLQNVLLKSARYFCWEHFFKVSHRTIGGEVSATDYPIHTVHTFYPDKIVCQMAVFVRVTCFLGITKSWSERCYGTLTSKGGPWIPIALPNAYTLSHILFCCLYVHQVLDMYDSDSFRSKSQDIDLVTFDDCFSHCCRLCTSFFSHCYAAFSCFLKGCYFLPSRIQIYVWLHLSK